jgi:hypothetical protein
MAKIAAVLLLSFGLSALAFGQGGKGGSNQGGKSGGSSPSAPSNGSSPSNSGGPPAAGAPAGGGGGFSIEAEILAYKALQSDSEAIACDVAGFLVDSATKISPNGPNARTKDKSKGATPQTASCAGSSVSGSTAKGVVLLSASGTTLANFQA